MSNSGAWYLGGLASMGAVCCTHPLDTIKVQLQTQQQVKFGFIGITKHIVRTNGVLALYDGISASLLRQATYSTTRFAIYESMKKTLVKPGQKNIEFWKSIVLAGSSGAIGAAIGAPADLVNVRMQNDSKLPKELKRNYKHCFDGLIRIYKEEGFKSIFNGSSMAIIRGAFVTIGQLAFYDKFKQILLKTKYFNDNLVTHFSASLLAGCVATTITMPLDVLKTRLMNASGKSGLFVCLKDVLSLGPSALFKGFVPAFIRLGNSY